MRMKLGISHGDDFDVEDEDLDKFEDEDEAVVSKCITAIH